MDILIHDLEAERFQALFPEIPDGVRVISKTGEIKPCVGCFGCWVKTPGKCVIQDGYEALGEWLCGAERVTLISRCVYGGYSPFIKNVLDRSISYLLPFFKVKNGTTHHQQRYAHRFSLRVYFYGDISEEERAVAEVLVQANALNYHTSTHKVAFCQAPEQLSVEEVLL